MEAFFASFLQYVITMVVLGVFAFAGAFTGKKLRESKDAKASERPRINQ